MDEQQDLFAEMLPPRQPRHAERLRNVQEGLPAGLWLGTTSWTNEDWEGLVYPEGGAAQDYIEHYARVFRSVEIDTTWYRIPTPRMVDTWLARTPDEFRFAAKVPRVISHEKGLVECMGEMEEFLGAMERMGERLGPLLLQFPYVARGKDAQESETGVEFMGRLERFLEALPGGDFRLAVEVRNGRWVGEELVGLLRAHGAALVLNNYYTMPDIEEVCARVDPLTADFLYVRFLGDRKKMDEYVDGLIRAGHKQRRWDRLVWDREAEVVRWARQVRKLAGAEREVFAFFNNHYAGYAPGSLGLFARAWKEE